MNTLPDTTITEVVKKVFNTGIRSQQVLKTASDHEVHEVETEGGERAIVKISQDPTDPLHREFWVMGLCDLHGVPAPRVLGVGEMTLGDQTFMYSVQEEMKGTPLVYNLAKGDEAANKALIAQASEMLHKIHTIPTSGFGLLDRHGRGQYQMQSDYLKSIQIHKQAIMTTCHNLNIPTDAIDSAFIMFSEFEAELRALPSSLLHNEFSPAHIFVEEGKICGIIGWGSAIGGDPVQEFASWDYREKIPVRWLMEGYPNKAVFTAGFERKLHLYRLYLGLEALYKHPADGKTYALLDDKTNVLKDLQYFGLGASSE